MNGNMNAVDGQITAGESVADALRLDGNAAAGILSEIFVPDLTSGSAKCARLDSMQEPRQPARETTAQCRSGTSCPG